MKKKRDGKKVKEVLKIVDKMTEEEENREWKEKVETEKWKDVYSGNVLMEMQKRSLSRVNRHPRDARIRFDEAPHLYYIDGCTKGYISVTTYNHHLFPPFDRDKIAGNIMRAKKWDTDPTYRYYRMNKEEIWANWEHASWLGTRMHEKIEWYWNGVNVIEEDTSLEISYFHRFVAANPDLKPYRTEWMIFDEELKLAGSIDMVFEKPDGTLLIYDWKRCNDIPKEFGKYTKEYGLYPCVADVPNLKFHLYSMQLNVYKYMLEKLYGVTISGMALVWLHPDQSDFIVLEVADMTQTLIPKLIDFRIECLRDHDGHFPPPPTKKRKIEHVECLC